jgi:hypothetical protein
VLSASLVQFAAYPAACRSAATGMLGMSTPDNSAMILSAGQIVECGPADAAADEEEE